MTPFVLHHYDASRSPSLVTPFPSIVILNGGKNALWERQETEQWHRVKNLLPWMTSYGFPRHDNRSFAIARDDALPSPSLRQQILRWRSEWRLAIRRHSALLADSSQLIAFIFLPFSSPRQQILLRWYPKQWANSVSYFQSFVSDPQLSAIGHHSLSERLGLFIKIVAKGIQFLYFSMYNKVQTEGSADHLYWCSFYLPVRKTAES